MASRLHLRPSTVDLGVFPSMAAPDRVPIGLFPPLALHSRSRIDRPASVRSPRSRRMLVGSRTSSRSLLPLQRSQLGEFTSRNRTRGVVADISDAGPSFPRPEGRTLGSRLHPTFRGHPLPDSRRIGRRLWTAWSPSGAVHRRDRYDRSTPIAPEFTGRSPTLQRPVSSANVPHVPEGP